MTKLQMIALPCAFLVLFGGILPASGQPRAPAERGRGPRPQSRGRGPSQQKVDAPPDIQRAMKEMWRRGTCLLSSVHKPAETESAVPKDLGATAVLYPRIHARQGALLCYAADGGTLWAADDQGLYQVDAAAAKLTRTYDVRAGLPDAAVQSIAPAGRTVWLATRGRLARLDVEAGTIAPVEGVQFDMGRLAAGPSGVWLVSDAGAYRLAPGEKQWRKLPDFPAQDLLAGQVRRGFWWEWWHRKMRVLLPSVFATADGLYVVCMNRLSRYDPAAGKWQELGQNVWQAVPSGRTVWALVTEGVLGYDAATGKTTHYRAGAGPAAGRPVAMAVSDQALLLASQPDYDDKPKTRRDTPQQEVKTPLTGGGISRLDLASGKWTVTDAVDGVDVRFASAVQAEAGEAWASCILYDKIHERGAHPGMAHVRSYRPHATGIGLLHYAGGRWHLVKREGLKTEQRWVMGQRGKVKTDLIGPESVDQLCRCGKCVWGVYRIVPEQYYSGYFISAGCLAEQSDGHWQGRFDVRTKELGFEGEQPKLMLISHSHGHRIVLADGHPIVLGMESIAGRTWVISEGGLFAQEPGDGGFVPVLRETARLYWRATAAAAGEDCVWFGGDGGTISRLDRKTGRLELLGVAEGRSILHMVAGDGGVRAVTSKSDAVLPVSLAAATKLPEGDVLEFDGRRWTAGAGQVAPKPLPYTFKSRSNYLYKADKRVAFLKGVFRPIVLCEDRVGGKLWVGTYAGVASVPLSPQGAE